jgi:hypothetical protein
MRASGSATRSDTHDGRGPSSSCRLEVARQVYPVAAAPTPDGGDRRIPLGEAHGDVPPGLSRAASPGRADGGRAASGAPLIAWWE